MAKRKTEHETAEGEVVVQLATRVPKGLYRELKLYSVTESRSISELVTEYIREGLKAAKPVRQKSSQKRRRSEDQEDAA